jgi:hypothetical protein
MLSIGKKNKFPPIFTNSESSTTNIQKPSIHSMTSMKMPGIRKHGLNMNINDISNMKTSGCGCGK